LTVGEAMICGCAVACTDNDGYKEMAIDGVTALLSPIKKPIDLAENIIKLIENDSLRLELSERGYEYIKQFDWEKSYSKLRSYMN
jgi:glycosyltransferase involved in cell wall biosynthesis